MAVFFLLTSCGLHKKVVSRKVIDWRNHEHRAEDSSVLLRVSGVAEHDACIFSTPSLMVEDRGHGKTNG